MADQEIIRRPLTDYPPGVSVLAPDLPVAITHADECRCEECRFSDFPDRSSRAREGE
jgi:hypothetical protein